jgi:hypothetical protein
MRFSRRYVPCAGGQEAMDLRLCMTVSRMQKCVDDEDRKSFISHRDTLEISKRADEKCKDMITVQAPSFKLKYVHDIHRAE